MDRRSFLKTTAVGVGAVGSGSCAHLGTTVGSSSQSVLELVGELRATLDSIASPSAQVAAGPDDSILRGGAQSLLLAGAFHSMAEDVRAHPAVQELMFENLAMMNTNAHQLQQVAIASTPEERRQLTRDLKEDPDLVSATAQELDAEAVRLGLSGELRVRLRGLFFQVGSRLTQSASLAIEEYSHKVARIEARMAEPRGFEREYISRIGEQAFWEFQARQDTYARAWAGVPPAPPVPQTPPPPPALWAQPAAPVVPVPDPKAAARAAAARAQMLAEDGSVASPLGAALLGLGLISSSVGAVLIVALGGVLSTGLVGAFVITAGVLLVIAGIILMAVGGGRADRAMKMRAAP